MRALGLVLVAAVAAVGCTAILGDFTIGKGGPNGGDGGGDAQTEGGAEGGTFTPLTCAEDVNRKLTKIDTLVANPNGGNGGFYYFTTSSKAESRIIIDPGMGKVSTYTINTDNMTVKSVVTEPGRLIVAERIPNGIHALIQDQTGMMGTNDLYLRTLQDAANAWDPIDPKLLVGKAGEFQSMCVREGSLLTTDIDVFAVLSVSTNNQCNTPTGITAYRVGNPGGVPWGLGSLNAATVGVRNNTLAVDAKNLYLLASTSQGGGPTSGSSPALFTADRMTLVAQPPVKLGLANPSDLIDVLVMQNAVEPEMVNLSFFGGDLMANQTAIWNGKMALGKLDKSVPQKDLAQTSVADVSELPVGQPQARWSTFPSGQYLLEVSSVFQGPGVDFYWFDDKGTLIAKQAGATALLQSEGAGTIVAQAVDFAGPPISKFLAQFGVAVVEKVNGSLDVKVAGVICKK